MLKYILGRMEKPEPVAEGARLPRVTRLLALALKCEGLVRSGTIPDYAELARRGWVTRARITQIMNLLHLATPIQEEILNWSEVENKRDPVSERALGAFIGGCAVPTKAHRSPHHQMRDNTTCGNGVYLGLHGASRQ